MRRLIVLLLALAMSLGFAAPAMADHGGPVDGLWWSADPDGSFVLLTVIEGKHGHFNVILFDTLATGACTPPAPFIGTSRDALFDDGSANPEGRKVLFVNFGHNTCIGRSRPTLPGIDAQFEVLVDDRLMVDDAGILWFHIAG